MKNTIKRNDLIEVFHQVRDWLQSDDTWDAALDGLDKVDCCHATLRKLQEILDKLE